MKKLLLFPLDENVEWLIQNQLDNKEYKIEAVSSYYADKEKLKLLQKKITVLCSENFEECLKKVNGVVFCENVKGYDYIGYEKRVKKALEHKCDIYIKASILNKLKIEENNPLIHIIQKEDTLKEDDKGKLKEITVPIISILGLGEHCNKFILQNKMKRIIEKRGYRILSITPNMLGMFNDMEIFPGFIFSNNIALPRKVKMLNEWVYSLCQKEEFDAILLAYPSGILWLDEYEPNFYSEIPMIISNAVIADEGVLAVYKYFNRNKESMETLDKLCQEKYNIPIKYFIGSDWCYQVDYEKREVDYFRDGKKEISNNYDEESYCYMTIGEDDKLEKMTDKILQNLEENICMI